MIKKVGLVVMFDMSSCGGAPQVVLDTIGLLNSMGKEVYLLTPFKLDYKVIEKCGNRVDIKKIYYPSKVRSLVCKGNFLPRRFMKKEFQQMTKEVDIIIDIDGGLVHNYLPKNFDKYFVWRFSCVFPDLNLDWSFSRKIKERMKIILGARRCIPSGEYEIYAHDDWTKQELSKHLGLHCQDMCLYAGVRTKEFSEKEVKKKNQIIIFGRIAQNKRIDDSILLFDKGTKEHTDYNLVIFGGITADTKDYVKKLKKLIEDLKISERVKIIESPSFEEIKILLAESKIVINSQRPISINQTSIEAMAAGNIILAHKDSGVFTELLENGKWGFGFEEIDEGGNKLKEIIENLENGKLYQKEFSERAEFFSEEKYKERLNKIFEKYDK